MIYFKRKDAQVPSGLAPCEHQMISNALHYLNEDARRRNARDSGGAVPAVVNHPMAIPLELFVVNVGGAELYMLLVSSQKHLWAANFRMVIINRDASFQVSAWETYQNPIRVGGWMYFSEYHTDFPTLALVTAAVEEAAPTTFNL